MIAKSMLERLNTTRPMIVSAKYQVTMPVAIRKHLGINPRDRVCFQITPDGAVVIAAVRRRA